MAAYVAKGKRKVAKVLYWVPWSQKKIGVRTYNGVLNMFSGTPMESVTLEMILAEAPRKWLRLPNFGRGALNDLSEALGYRPGWNNEYWEELGRLPPIVAKPKETLVQTLLEAPPGFAMTWRPGS